MARSAVQYIINLNVLTVNTFHIGIYPDLREDEERGGQKRIFRGRAKYVRSRGELEKDKSRIK